MSSPPLPAVRPLILGLLTLTLVAPALAGKPTKPGGGTNNPPALPPVRYALTWIEFTPGLDSRAWGMNESGEVVGAALKNVGDPLWTAFLYSGGELIDLNTLLSDADAAVWHLESAWDISDATDLLGNPKPRQIVARATKLTDGGTERRTVRLTLGFEQQGETVVERAYLEDICPDPKKEVAPAGEPSGFADINNRGDMLIRTSEGLLIAHHLYLDPGDGSAPVATDPDQLTGRDIKSILGINDARQITGTYAATVQKGIIHHRAFFFDPAAGRFSDLGLSTDLTAYSEGVANDWMGVVAGYGDTAAKNGKRHAFRYDPATGMTQDLHALGDLSISHSINGNGTIAGHWSQGDGTGRGFVYTDGYGMLKLDDLLLPEAAADPFWQAAMMIRLFGNASAAAGYEGYGPLAGNVYTGTSSADPRRAFLLMPVLP